MQLKFILSVLKKQQYFNFFFLQCKEVRLQKDNFHVKDLYVSILLLSAVLLRKYNPGMNDTTVTTDNYISHRIPENMCKL